MQTNGRRENGQPVRASEGTGIIPGPSPADARRYSGLGVSSGSSGLASTLPSPRLPLAGAVLWCTGSLQDPATNAV